MAGSFDRRVFLSGAAAVGLLGVLTACQPGGTGPVSTATGPLAEFLRTSGKKYTGQTVNVSCINSVQSDAIKSIVGDFESLTGIQVNMTSLEETAQTTKLSVTLDARSGAFDVYQMQNDFVPQYGNKDWFTPVEELKSKSPTVPDLDMSVYAPAALASLQASGKQLAMPMFLATQVVYYRTDVFEKAGISEAPKTLAGLEKICDPIKSAGTTPIAMRGAIGAGMNLYPWSAWLYNLGGGYYEKYDAANNKYSTPRLSAPESIEAAETYSRVIQKYAPGGCNNWTFSDVTKAFLAGEVAMMQEGSPFGGAVNDPKRSAVAGKVAAFPVPAGPAGNYPPSGVQGWAIPRVSKNQDAAWLFVQWATNTDTFLKAAIVSSFPAPPTPSVLQDKDFIKKYDFKGFLDALHASYQSKDASPIGGPFLPGLLNWQAAGQEVSTLLNKTISNQISASEAMEQADKVLAQYA